MKAAVLIIFGLWFLAQALGVYAFGWSGLFESLDQRHYVGHPVDFIMHWILFFGPPIAALSLLISTLFKKR